MTNAPDPDIDEARADLTQLEAQLSGLAIEQPDADSAARQAARAFLQEQLPRRVAWGRDAHTGPRR